MTRTARVASLIASMTVVAAAAVLRRQQLRWGANRAEISTPLTGDELVAEPNRQHLDVGDAVRLAPELALKVAVAKPPRSLVLQGGVLPGTTIAPYDFTWTFDLLPVSTATTRLVVRERYAYTRWWARLMVEPLTVVSFLMSRRMLHGIRDRAEQTSHEGEHSP